MSSSGLSAHPFVERPKVAVNGTQAENVHRVEWTMAKWHESEKDIERIVMIEEDLCSLETKNFVQEDKSLASAVLHVMLLYMCVYFFQ